MAQASTIKDSWKHQLVKEAMRARQQAYAPYSRYLVGAALQTKTGEIITGSNIENASYGLTNCAERTAIFTAIHKGLSDIEAIAVVTEKGGMPCGACRQVLNEFNPYMTIIIANQSGEIISELSLADLLPQAFGPNNLAS